MSAAQVWVTLRSSGQFVQCESDDDGLLDIPVEAFQLLDNPAGVELSVERYFRESLTTDMSSNVRSGLIETFMSSRVNYTPMVVY